METNNTIYEFFLNQTTAKTEYIGLEEAANKAFSYLVDCHEKGMCFSEIFLSMPKELGYVLHPASFHLGWEMLVSFYPLDQKNDCIILIQQADDMNMYKKGCSTLEVFDDFAIKQVVFEKKNGLVYDYPMFPVGQNIVTPDIVTSPPENSVSSHSVTPESDSSRSSSPEDTRIILPAKEIESSSESWYTTEFTFNDHSKKILLYTIITFATIQLLAWYFKNDNKKDNIQVPDESSIENEVLNSVSETLYLSSTLFYKLLIGLIPISIVILYNLRYYYYYKFIKIRNKHENN